jgi:AcrR family transcriptional regulator
LVADAPDSGRRPRHPRSADTAPARRSYEGSQRARQAAATRERILAAAADIVHALPDWDWRDLTVRAVARRAEVDESTVYRHFSSERNLRDAVLRRLVSEAGVDLDGLRLANFGEVLGQTFSYLATFPVTSAPANPAASGSAGDAGHDPAFAALDDRRRDALLAAVARAAPDWEDDKRRMAAAAIDAYWSVTVYQRMVSTWDLDTEQATGAVTWVIDLIETAVRTGRGPRPAGADPAAPRPGQEPG